MIKFQITQGVKLTKESLPALTDKIKSGKAEYIIMSQFKGKKFLGMSGSTLKRQQYKDNAVARLEQYANLPEGCGETFVEIG